MGSDDSKALVGTFSTSKCCSIDVSFGSADIADAVTVAVSYIAYSDSEYRADAASVCSGRFILRELRSLLAIESSYVQLPRSLCCVVRCRRVCRFDQWIWHSHWKLLLHSVLCGWMPVDV